MPNFTKIRLTVWISIGKEYIYFVPYILDVWLWKKHYCTGLKCVSYSVTQVKTQLHEISDTVTVLRFITIKRELHR